MLRRIESTIWARGLDYKYLWWIFCLANKLGLKGTTFFKADGAVEVIAEGEEENLMRLVKKISRGRAFMRIFTPIENFSVRWKNPENEFEVFFISEHSIPGE